MRFQKRILLSYAVLLAVAMIIMGIVYCRISWKHYMAEEISYLKTLNSQMMRQVELEYASMQEATESLLSDSAILDNLKILASVPEGNTYRAEAEKAISIRLNTYHIVKNYYRVLLYNGRGDVFASYDFDERKIREEIPKEQEKWIEKATGRGGKTLVIPVHQDPWGIKEQPQVYGLIREILGPDLGYLEVQQKEDTLKRIFELYDPNIQAAAFYEDGQILYGTEAAEIYREFCSEGRSQVIQLKNPETGKREILSASYSDLAGVTILLTEDRSVILKKMFGILMVGFWSLILFVSFSFFFLLQVSKNIARPINELRGQMEQARIDNLDEAIQVENSMDEIQALADAYGRMLKRLKESLTNERNLSYLQLQARYDLLQAQINPHFFHNVLNVLSSRGLSLGDETICEICASLSGMLRYSTGNRTRYAAIGEEIHYLEQYLSLMKLRYQHKLEYEIKVDERIASQQVPKIVFQQIVENSIQHGFPSGAAVMRIFVTGEQSEDRKQWRMEFKDNGDGIEKETVELLKEKMDEVKEKLLFRNQILELEIGGMGLLNTYARLLLLYGQEITFDIRGSEAGTVVTVAAPLGDGEE